MISKRNAASRCRLGPRPQPGVVFTVCAAMVVIALTTFGCMAGAPRADQRAALLVDRGQTDEALRVLRERLAEQPRDVATRRMLVRVLGVAGNMGEALREAERLASLLGARSPIPWIELGHAYELSHQYEQALKFYDRAADVAPADPSGAREGGVRAARWGEAELARPRLEEALRRDPRDARLWHALGVVRLRLDDVDGARTAYRSGLMADPRALENRIGLATVALATDDPESALSEYDAIVAARPRFADAHLGRSWALLLLGRLGEARQALETGARLGANPRVVTRQRELVQHLQKGAKSNVESGSLIDQKR
jgi:Flp pilus assembly protein TadD